MSLLNLPEPPHKARILVAIGMQRSAIVICTDSEWVHQEVIDISPHCDDVGILSSADYKGVADCSIPPGIYLWEGVLKVVGRNSMDGWEAETDYSGNIRPVEPAELTALLAMQPPDEPLQVDEDIPDHAELGIGDA